MPFITFLESEMPSEHIGRYEVEYFAVKLTQRQVWTAHVAIFGPSRNPMHRQCVFPDQRVCVEHTYPSKEEAEEEARRYAYSVMQAEPLGR